MIFLGKTSWTRIGISVIVSRRLGWMCLRCFDVTGVPVSPSSVVAELCDCFSCGSGWDFVELQSFSFFKKRVHSCTATQKEMWSEEQQVRAPPMSRSRMMPPTPMENSYASFEEEQGHVEVEDQMWSARDRAVIGNTKQYLENSESFKVEIEELEFLLGPDETDVEFRRILEEARDKKGFAIVETFSTDGPSAFLAWSVVTRWDRGPKRG